MPKSQARVSSARLCDIDRSACVFARLSIRTPQFRHTRSGMRTRFLFTSFQSFVSVEPRSSSAIRWPKRSRSAATTLVPTAPMAILRKKLESGLNAKRATSFLAVAANELSPPGPGKGADTLSPTMRQFRKQKGTKTVSAPFRPATGTGLE